MALLPMIASAKEVEIDGINYYIDVEKKTANVAYNGKYTGTQIIIPSSILYEGDSYSVIGINTMAFSNNRDLISVEIPNSVTSIGGQAFYNCINLVDIIIPDGVTSVGNQAFDCTQWYYNQEDGVVYAGSVVYKYKGTMPFNAELVLKEGATTICNYAFQDCNNLISVTLPNSVTSIGEEAFRDCINLKSIEISNSLTKIGQSAFSGCRGLTSLSFPQSVKTIEGNAFGGCSGLTFIKVYRNRPIAITDEFDSAFTDVDKETCILYVPKGTATMYMSAPGWMEFENIVEFEEESAINQLDVTSDEDVDWYTLDGRKLEGQPTEKGIYIINGKKIYVK